MKLKNDDTYESVYNELENLKESCYDLVDILDFCQECISYFPLKYLPDEIEIRPYSVIFNLEGRDSNHLLVSFKKAGENFDDQAIDFFSFQKNELISKSNVCWKEVAEFINWWSEVEP